MGKVINSSDILERSSKVMWNVKVNDVKRTPGLCDKHWSKGVTNT